MANNDADDEQKIHLIKCWLEQFGSLKSEDINAEGCGLNRGILFHISNAQPIHNLLSELLIRNCSSGKNKASSVPVIPVNPLPPYQYTENSVVKTSRLRSLFRVLGQFYKWSIDYELGRLSKPEGEDMDQIYTFLSSLEPLFEYSEFFELQDDEFGPIPDLKVLASFTISSNEIAYSAALQSAYDLVLLFVNASLSSTSGNHYYIESLQKTFPADLQRLVMVEYGRISSRFNQISEHFQDHAEAHDIENEASLRKVDHIEEKEDDSDVLNLKLSHALQEADALRAQLQTSEYEKQKLEERLSDFIKSESTRSSQKSSSKSHGNDAVQSLKTQLYEVESERESLREQVSQLRRDLSSSETSQRDLSKKIQDNNKLKDELIETKSELERARRSAGVSEKQVKKLTDDLLELKQLYKNVLAENERLQCMQSHVQNSHKSETDANVKSDTETGVNIDSSVKSAISDLQAENTKLSELVEKLESDKLEAFDQVNWLEERIKELEEISESSAMGNDSQPARQNSVVLNKMLSEKNLLQTELMKYKDLLIEKERELAEISQSKAVIETKFSSMENVEAKASAELSELRTKVTLGENKIAELTDQISKYHKAIDKLKLYIKEQEKEMDALKATGSLSIREMNSATEPYEHAIKSLKTSLAEKSEEVKRLNRNMADIKVRWKREQRIMLSAWYELSMSLNQQNSFKQPSERTPRQNNSSPLVSSSTASSPVSWLTKQRNAIIRSPLKSSPK